MTPEDEAFVKQGFGTITDGDLVLQYLNDRWRALVLGRSTGQCADCHACCRSGYVIGLSTAEAKQIAHTVIDGHAVLMPDKDGVCPHFIDNKCTVYKVRPQSCRSFDCRDLAFAGLLVNEDKTMAGVDEMNSSIVRHMHNNGDKILFPMRKVAVRALATMDNNAIKAAQGALVTAIAALLPPQKFKVLIEQLQHPDEIKSEAAQSAGIKAQKT